MKKRIILFALLLLISSAGHAQTYCIPEGLNCESGDGPNYFLLTGEGSTEIDYDNTECNSNAYFDYSSSMGVTLYAGSDYSFDVQSGYTNQVLSIWIDFNDDNVFDDSEEVVVEEDFDDNITTISMSIPSSAPAGTYRMRVMGVYNSDGGDGPLMTPLAAVYPMDPCNLDDDGNPIYAYGKTLDFYVEIEDAPLPVDLISFNAIRKEKVAQLDWTTSGESRNKGFYIERSSDGTFWNDIGFVLSKADAQGKSEIVLHYKYMDITPLKGQNMYRLRQVDLGGQISYSPVRRLLFDWNSGETAILMYPNPAVDHVTIEGLESNEIIRVFNAAGILVMEKQARAAKEQINISILSAGLYLLQITNLQGKSEAWQIIKTDATH